MATVRHRIEVFDETKLICLAVAAVLDAIHALVDQMQSEPTGLDVVQVPPLEFSGIDSRALVAQQDFEALAGTSGRRPCNVAKNDFNGLVQFAEIGMAHDVGEGFIDRPGDRTGLFGGKTEEFREGFQSAANSAEQSGIAAQLEFEQQSVRGAGPNLGATLRIMVPSWTRRIHVGWGLTMSFSPLRLEWASLCPMVTKGIRGKNNRVPVKFQGEGGTPPGGDFWARCQ